MYFLPGMITGLLLARSLPGEPWILPIAFSLALLSAPLAKKGPPALWLAAFIPAVVLAFWFYGTVRLPAQPEAELLSRPPREALVEMEIKRIMQAETRYGKSTGVARVIRANETSRLEKNSLIYLRLSPHDTAEFEIMRGLAIQLTAVVRPIPEHVPPDSFDAYLQEIGIHYRLEQTSGARILRQPTPFQRLCHQANRKFENFLKLGEPEDSQLSQIYVAMLLGEKAQLSDEQSDRFRMTGTMHLFAISGLHIGVIATVIWQVLLLCRLPSKLRPFLGLPLLYFYVEITGAAPSAVRAFLMVAFFWVSMGLQRQRSPLSALAASAVLVLLVQPLQLWQMGFQLSYLVVISILMFGLPLREQLWPLLRPNKFLPEADWSRFQIVKHWLADKLLLLFAISFSAWLASAPLSAGFFGFIAPYAILVNMFLVNLAALVISGGVIALSFACIGLEGLTSFLNHSAWMGISLMDALVRFNLALPWAIVECPEFPAALSYSGILAYLAAIFILGRKYKASIRFTLPVAVVLACLALGLAAGP